MDEWKANPEYRYRDGYEEGAWTLFRAIEGHLPTASANLVVAWLQEKIEPWRNEAQTAAMTGSNPPKILPPRLSVPN
jgi:hypothetical protein